MGDRPFDGAEIDRIDNNKGYYKDNCRWVTRKQNARNTRLNVLNEEIVKQMRESRKNGKPYLQIPREFKTAYSNVVNVLSGGGWA